MPKTEATHLIGSADAATELHIDRSTLTRWVKRNKLTPALIGSGATGEMFFHAKDIAALKSSPSSVASVAGDGDLPAFVPEEPGEPSTAADWADAQQFFEAPQGGVA